MYEIVKPIAAYAGTAALSWVASRYHLSGDQVTAIVADLGMISAAIYGVYAHHTAYNTDPKETQK